MIPPDARAKIIKESLAALSDVLAGVKPAMRKRIVDCVIQRIEAQAAGDTKMASGFGRALALDLRSAQRIAVRVAIERGLRIASIVATVIAANLSSLGGVLLSALAAFIGSDLDDAE